MATNNLFYIIIIYFLGGITMKPFREVYDCDSITLDITNDCNFKCVYCFEKDKNKKYMKSAQPKPAGRLDQACFSSSISRVCF